jgi:hypothetical protein
VAVACAVNRPLKAELAREPLALISDVSLVRLPPVGEVGVDDQELQQLRALLAEYPKMLGIQVAEPTHAERVARTPRPQTFPAPQNVGGIRPAMSRCQRRNLTVTARTCRTQDYQSVVFDGSPWSSLADAAQRFSLSQRCQPLSVILADFRS